VVRLGQTLRTARRGALLSCLLLGLSACTPATTTAEGVTDRAIRSIYAGDLEQTKTMFDGTVRNAMTPESFHILSHLMQSFGKYNSVSQISQIAGQRYDLEAEFDGGSMLVQLRLNAAGQIAALHFIPNFTPKPL
jgi:hypothetical protein